MRENLTSAKRRIRIVCIFIVCLLVSVLSGCNSKGEDRDTSNDTMVLTGTPTSEPTQEPMITPADTKDTMITLTPAAEPPAGPTGAAAEQEANAAGEGKAGKSGKAIPNTTEAAINLSDFKLLEDSFLDYKFEVKGNGAEDPEAFEVHGEYDLNKDGAEDKIKLFLNVSSDAETYIEINGIQKQFYLDSTYDGTVQLIDLDQEDSYIEVACFDLGPSDDLIYTFFRYDGKNLYELGDIDASALVDGKGKLVSWFHICRFQPIFCSAWYEIQNNEMVQKNNDIAKYLGKTYDFKGGEAFFMPFDKVPISPEVQWDETQVFDPCKIKLIDILYLDVTERTMNFFYVELPTGEKGLLYFWIGD